MRLNRWCVATALAAWFLGACSSGGSDSGIMMPAANTAGSSGSGSGGAGQCTTTLPRATATCETCMQSHCCDQITDCATLNCIVCAPESAACIGPVKTASAANLACAENNCSRECELNGSGGAAGSSGSSTGGASGASTCLNLQCGDDEGCLQLGDKAVCKKKCSRPTDCPNEACAPAAYAGEPIGPYICVPNDGGAYHGCAGLLTSCGDAYCCFADSNMNQFCAKPCTGTGIAECGFASCNTYDNTHTTCSGMKACGPLPP